MPSSISWQQPVLGAAAVQPVGDVAQRPRRSPRRRSRAAAAAPGRPARPRSARPAAGRRAGRSTICARRAVVLAQQRERQAVGVEDRVGLLLPALARQRLPEVAVPVEQADADDRHAEVAGRLEVVAGQDAEAAGVLRQHRGDAELRARSRRSRRRRRPAPSALVPAVAGQVLARGRRGPARAARRKPLSPASSLEPLAAARRRGSRTGSWPDAVPQLGVDGREEVLGLGVPGPAQVGGELAERRERLGQDGTDGEPRIARTRSTVAPARLERSNPAARTSRSPR